MDEGHIILRVVVTLINLQDLGLIRRINHLFRYSEHFPNQNGRNAEKTGYFVSSTNYMAYVRIFYLVI
jgi:hypothetical protein